MLSKAEDFLPCKHCLQFYKRESLYRHTKMCLQNTEVKLPKRKTSRSDDQTALLLGTSPDSDQLLKDVLFPHMRADEISSIAKTDPLICQSAYSYMKGRMSKAKLGHVKQNVRELAKLLKFVRSNNNIKHLIDVLRPCYFKLIIDGINYIAKCNARLAANLRLLVKKCCDLALVTLLQQQNTMKKRRDVKELKALLE